MDTTHADIEDATRLTITVTFISRRSIDHDGDTIHRLLVADQSGETFSLLAGPDSEPLLDLKTGAAHRFVGLLGSGSVTHDQDIQQECPGCGGHLRRGRAVDTADSSLTELVSQLSIDQPFGVIDAETTFRRVRKERKSVDDWNLMDADRTESQKTAVPERVCESCSRQFSTAELRAERDETQPGVLESRDTAAFSPSESRAVASSPASANAANQETLGLAAGGAKDVVNFRENIANGYTPQPEAISDEGLFYDYHFETGSRAESAALFAPRYDTAVTDHPVTGETERYVSVGLDSTLSGAEFQRPCLDLVVVLDVSGSMDSGFDDYYYDEHGTKHPADNAADTKLNAATESLCALTEQLHDEDQLGVVLYDHRAHVAKPLRDVGATDMPAIRRHIRDITANGSTNMEDGFQAAVDMLIAEESSRDVEQRVVFMTDMMPNTGATGKNELVRLFGDAATEGIHTTFVGMGLDANAELADELSGIRGGNHYFIHSAAGFERRLGEEFDYMVTPLVYDLTLSLETDGYEIEAVHGSPSADDTTGRLMHVGTLFPSSKQDGEARGGVVLVRVDPTVAGGELELVASWTERGGGEYTERVTVNMPDEPDSYAHGGVRKAVVLCRYASELRAWARDVHERARGATGADDWLLPDQRGSHERDSVSLVVPDQYNERFSRVREYLKSETSAIGDETMRQELDLLETLCEQAPATPQEVNE